MNKIAFIVPYIGKFNNYFPLFLKSCQFNSDVDFLFFTDDKRYLGLQTSSNIRFIETTLAELKERAQNYFDFPISLERPYKLCDYKPCYGLMFSDYLSDYNYWGHCDTDIIFGNIKKILGDILNSNRYGRILRHGHLSIYRNDEFSNNIFKEERPQTYNGWAGIVSFKEVYQSNKSFAYDEAGGTALIWLRYYKELLFDDLSIFKNPISNKKAFKENQNSGGLRYYSFIDGTLFDCFRKNGEDFRKEILYVHFYRRRFKIKCSTDISSFSVIPNKFVGELGAISLSKRIFLCYKVLYWEFYLTQLNRVKKRIFK